MNVLHLSLRKPPFDVMVTGEKPEEYRKHGDWIDVRLYNKATRIKRKYDLVRFTNGYGSDKPFFYAEFKGFYHASRSHKITYSNGFTVEIEPGDIVIKLGKITKKRNYGNT